MGQIRVLACVAVVTVTVLPMPATAWNIPGHMLSGAIAYQVLQQESPQTIDKVKAMLEKHPWYANQWQARLEDVPAVDHDLVLFMQAASGLTTFATTTSNSTVRCGTTSIGRSSPMDNHQACKPKSLSR